MVRPTDELRRNRTAIGHIYAANSPDDVADDSADAISAATCQASLAGSESGVSGRGHLAAFADDAFHRGRDLAVGILRVFFAAAESSLRAVLLVPAVSVHGRLLFAPPQVRNRLRRDDSDSARTKALWRAIFAVLRRAARMEGR